VVIRLEHGQVTEVCFSVEIVTSVGVDFEIELLVRGNLISLQCCALSFTHILFTR